MKIELSRSELGSLSDFIEFELIPSIRRDCEVDNLQYIHNLLNIYDVVNIALELEDESNANQ